MRYHNQKNGRDKYEIGQMTGKYDAPFEDFAFRSEQECVDILVNYAKQRGQTGNRYKKGRHQCDYYRTIALKSAVYINSLIENLNAFILTEEGADDW